MFFLQKPSVSEVGNGEESHHLSSNGRRNACTWLPLTPMNIMLQESKTTTVIKYLRRNICRIRKQAYITANQLRSTTIPLRSGEQKDRKPYLPKPQAQQFPAKTSGSSSKYVTQMWKSRKFPAKYLVKSFYERLTDSPQSSASSFSRRDNRFAFVRL